MRDRPWWRQLDGQPPNPWWWESRLARVGLIGLVIFGGGFPLRVVFADELGDAALWGVLALPFGVLLIVGIQQARSQRR